MSCSYLEACQNLLNLLEQYHKTPAPLDCSKMYFSQCLFKHFKLLGSPVAVPSLMIPNLSLQRSSACLKIVKPTAILSKPTAYPPSVRTGTWVTN